MNSDISMRIMDDSVSNKNPASALHNSVLPTPVGPRNKKDPIGRCSSDKPARERRMALETAAIPSSCPITRWPKILSICSNLSRSPSSILDTGIPVHRDTTPAISSAVTRLRSSVIGLAPSSAITSANCFSNAGIFPYCSSDILLKSPVRRATSN